MRFVSLGLVLIAGIALAAPAMAQTAPLTSARPPPGRPNFPIHDMNFDLWCLETQHYSADRCNERRPEDVRAFEDFRTIIQRYEIEFIRKREQEAASADLRNRDPGTFEHNLQNPFSR